MKHDGVIRGRDNIHDTWVCINLNESVFLLSKIFTVYKGDFDAINAALLTHSRNLCWICGRIKKRSSLLYLILDPLKWNLIIVQKIMKIVLRKN